MKRHWKLYSPYLKETSFVNLMERRIANILLIANPYDAFMLEDDGRIDEKIFNEYTRLGLRYPPRFIRVATLEEALQELTFTVFDLVICMPGTDNSDAFDIARTIKMKRSSMPIVVLTPFSHGITKRMEHEDLSIFEYVFCWLGNTDLLLSIIKLIEDKMNLARDIESGVHMMLLVEDSIRFYSSMLPHLYKFVLQQSQEFATEALNAHQATLRMRSRPKIVLARNYEEALSLYEQYSDHTLGVISDVCFPREGVLDETAGFTLLRAVRAHDEFVPLIIQSSESTAVTFAHDIHASFVDKHSRKMNIDLRTIISEHFGFGDFIFRDPVSRTEICRVKNLKELQDNIFSIPKESLHYHISRNHVSRWLCARALFPISAFLKHITWESLQDVEAHRQLIYDAIVYYRRMKNQGVVAVFQRERFDQFSNFARIGEGSLGGKGRGLAFIDHILKRHNEFSQFEKAHVAIPKTLVLCTDIFDEFMEENGLYPIALSEADDEEILRQFLRAHLPDRLIEDFFAFFEAIKSPLAIRSSSLLEDAHYQPFAGVYSTYMIPHHTDRYEMLRMVSDAVKSVYASVYFAESKAYMTATSNVIDQEKMAVILQEVVGREYGNRFYPHISGVARSLNYYPLGDEKAEEGIMNLALGLGKYIVDGGQTLHVCPHHPGQVLQTSEMEIALRETQTHFYALDLTDEAKQFRVDNAFNLLKLPVGEAEKDGVLTCIASTYDPYDMAIYEGVYPNGRKLITFCNVLENGVFPLPELVQLAQKFGQEEMRRPVEIEFAVKLNEDHSGTFYLLQIRPIVDAKGELDEDLALIAREKTLLYSESSLGHGIITDVHSVVYVRTEGFSPANNSLVAEEITRLNKTLQAQEESYVLIGPGRWGSSDSWLGIPVRWPNISQAKVIVEAGLTNYRIDPSQGTHFFQNLTSFGVGYFTINDYRGEGVYNQALLDSMPALYEGRYIRQVRFEAPLTIKMDGTKKLGTVLLPEEM